MNPHDIIGDAKPNKGGAGITDGSYIFAVENLICNTEGNDGVTFIAELRVMKSDPIPVQAGQLNPGEGAPEPLPVGTSCSYVQKVGKFKSAKGNWKAFFCANMAGLGYSEAQCTGQLSAAVCQPHQPVRGALVKGVSYRRQNQGRDNPANKGQWMTLMNWYPQGEQTELTIKEVRAYLDATSQAAPATAMQQVVGQAVQQAYAQPAVQPAPAPVQQVAPQQFVQPAAPAQPAPATFAQPAPQVAPSPVAGGILGGLFPNLPK